MVPASRVKLNVPAASLGSVENSFSKKVLPLKEFSSLSSLNTRQRDSPFPASSRAFSHSSPWWERSHSVRGEGRLQRE